MKSVKFFLLLILVGCTKAHKADIEIDRSTKVLDQGHRPGFGRRLLALLKPVPLSVDGHKFRLFERTINPSTLKGSRSGDPKELVSNFI